MWDSGTKNTGNWFWKLKQSKGQLSMNNSWVGTRETSGVDALQLPCTPEDSVRFRGPNLGIKEECHLSPEHTQVLNKASEWLDDMGAPRKEWHPEKHHLNTHVRAHGDHLCILWTVSNSHCPQKMLASQNWCDVIQGAGFILSLHPWGQYRQAICSTSQHVLWASAARHEALQYQWLILPLLSSELGPGPWDFSPH